MSTMPKPAGTGSSLATSSLGRQGKGGLAVGPSSVRSTLMTELGLCLPVTQHFENAKSS